MHGCVYWRVYRDEYACHCSEKITRADTNGLLRQGNGVEALF